MANMPLRLGQYLVLCDRCKFKRYSDQVQKTWNGLMVCKPTVKPGCFETRHPQEFIRPPKEDQPIPFSRPRPTDVFVEETWVDSDVGVQDTRIPSGTFTGGL